MTVLAYETQDNLFVIDSNMGFDFYTESGTSLFYNVGISDDGKYHLNNGNIEGIKSIVVTNQGSEQWTFPYNGLSYDYYFLGSLTAVTTDRDMSTFKPTIVSIAGWDFDNNWSFTYPTSNTVIYNIDSFSRYGFGFYQKVDFGASNNVGINHISMSGDLNGIGNKPAGLVAEFCIMAIEKGTSEEAALSQILSQLQSMESSINSSIGSAAGQISGSVSDAAGQISGSVSDAADQITGTIEDQYTMSDSEDFGVGQIADQVEEKLGVLTFGADTLHNFLDLFSAENVGSTQLTFPAFQIEVQGVSYNVWPDMIFDLSFLEEYFGVLITAVRSVTVLCVWLAVLGYLVKAKDHFINNKG